MRPVNLGTLAVNAYLFPTLAGYLLVDTGYPGGGEAFFRRLSRKKIDRNELQWIFLTHAHDDHAGFLNDVLRGTRARVLLHPLAVERLRSGHNPPQGGPPNGRAALACRALRLAGKGGTPFRPSRGSWKTASSPWRASAAGSWSPIWGCVFWIRRATPPTPCPCSPRTACVSAGTRPCPGLWPAARDHLDGGPGGLPGLLADAARRRAPDALSRPRRAHFPRLPAKGPDPAAAGGGALTAGPAGKHRTTCGNGEYAAALLRAPDMRGVL